MKWVNSNWICYTCRDISYWLMSLNASSWQAYCTCRDCAAQPSGTDTFFTWICRKMQINMETTSGPVWFCCTKHFFPGQTHPTRPVPKEHATVWNNTEMSRRMPFTGLSFFPAFVYLFIQVAKCQQNVSLVFISSWLTEACRTANARLTSFIAAASCQG